MAWSAKHNKYFVGLVVDPGYVEDPSSMDFGNPTVIATINPPVLPLVLRRAQFSACANISRTEVDLCQAMTESTVAADAQATHYFLESIRKIAQKRSDEANNVVRTPVAGTPFSIIEGGKAPCPQPTQETEIGPPPPEAS